MQVPTVYSKSYPALFVSDLMVWTARVLVASSALSYSQLEIIVS
jgi:hypothetical protein